MAAADGIRRQIAAKEAELRSKISVYGPSPRVRDFGSTEEAKRFRARIRKLNRDIKRLQGTLKGREAKIERVQVRRATRSVVRKPLTDPVSLGSWWKESRRESFHDVPPPKKPPSGARTSGRSTSSFLRGWSRRKAEEDARKQQLSQQREIVKIQKKNVKQASKKAKGGIMNVAKKGIFSRSKTWNCKNCGAVVAKKDSRCPDCNMSRKSKSPKKIPGRADVPQRNPGMIPGGVAGATIIGLIGFIIGALI